MRSTHRLRHRLRPNCRLTLVGCRAVQSARQFGLKSRRPQEAFAYVLVEQITLERYGCGLCWQFQPFGKHVDRRIVAAALQLAQND